MWHDQLGHHFHHLHFLSGSLGRQHYHCGSRTSAITTSVKLWDWVRQDFLSGEDWQQIFLSGGLKKACWRCWDVDVFVAVNSTTQHAALLDMLALHQVLRYCACGKSHKPVRTWCACRALIVRCWTCKACLISNSTLWQDRIERFCFVSQVLDIESCSI